MIRRLWPYFASCLLALTAGHMFNYTVILYLQETVGSDLLAGLGFGLAFGTSLVFGWFAGVLCDRVAPHQVIHGAQALFLCGLGCLAWAQSLPPGSGRVAGVMLGAFMGGLAWSFLGPARLTTLAQIASATELRSATIIYNLQVLVGFGLAPLVIGLVRSRAGWEVVLAISATGFVAASLLIIRIHSQAGVRSGPAASVVADLREGFAAVKADPLLAQLMGMTLLGYALTGPLQIMLPRLAREVLGLSELQRGLYLGLLALSLIAGGITALALSKKVHHGRVMLGGVLAGSLVFASLSQIGVTAVSAIALASVGMAGGTVISLVVAGIQSRAPQALRGRVMSMYSIASQVVPAASGVCAGALINATGLVPGMLIAGLALATAVALGAWRMPVLRGFVGH